MHNGGRRRERGNTKTPLELVVWVQQKTLIKKKPFLSEIIENKALCSENSLGLSQTCIA